MNKYVKMGVAVIGGAALLSAGVLGGFVLDNPEPVVNETLVTNLLVAEQKILELENIEPKVIVRNNTIIKEVNVTKEVEVEKEIEVDNGDLEFVLDRLEDKEIIEDANEIVEELKAEDKAFESALDFLKDEKEFFDLLEEENIIDDENDVKIIRIYSDFEDVDVIESDFDDNEYSFDIRVKIEDLEDEVKKYVIATIEVEDNEVSIKNVVEE